VDSINITRAQRDTLTLRKTLPSARAVAFVIAEFISIPPDHNPRRWHHSS